MKYFIPYLSIIILLSDTLLDKNVNIDLIIARYNYYLEIEKLF